MVGLTDPHRLPHARRPHRHLAWVLALIAATATVTSTPAAVAQSTRATPATAPRAERPSAGGRIALQLALAPLGFVPGFVAAIPFLSIRPPLCAPDCGRSAPLPEWEQFGVGLGAVVDVFATSVITSLVGMEYQACGGFGWTLMAATLGAGVTTAAVLPMVAASYGLLFYHPGVFALSLALAVTQPALASVLGYEASNRCRRIASPHPSNPHPPTSSTTSPAFAGG